MLVEMHGTSSPITLIHENSVGVNLGISLEKQSDPWEMGWMVGSVYLRAG